MQMNQQVRFFSDGGADIRDVQLYPNPEAEHYLDWFHITMRITVMGQYARGLETTPEKREEELKLLEGRSITYGTVTWCGRERKPTRRPVFWTTRKSEGTTRRSSGERLTSSIRTSRPTRGSFPTTANIGGMARRSQPVSLNLQLTRL
jgi:hypothetical protein